MNLQELAQVIEEDDVGKEDISISTSDIAVNEDGYLVVNNNNYHPNDWAWYLLFAKACKGATKTYLMKHPAEVWSKMVNIDLNNLNQPWVLRSRGNDILGIVTQKVYKVFNNNDVMRALIENLGEQEQVHRHYIDDKFFYLRSLYTDGDFKVGDDVYHIGFCTSNSEVGYRKLTNSGFVYKLSCQNDAQFMQNASMKFRHAGHSFEEMSNALGESIHAGRHLRDHYCELITRASNARIDDFSSNMEYVAKYMNLSRKRAEEITNIYNDEPNTKMGLVNAVTKYAQRLRGDQRFFLESDAGALLEHSIPCEK